MSRSTSSTDPLSFWPFVALGRVAGTHGTHGEVRLVLALAVDTDALVGLHVWFVPPPSRFRDGRIASARQSAKGLLVTLEGLDDVSTAKELVGCKVLCATSDLPAGAACSQGAGEPDLTGFSVDDERHGRIGEVVDTIHTKANDVWVVRGPVGEVLVPVIDDVVRAVDRAERTVRVRLLPGLLPGEDEVV